MSSAQARWVRASLKGSKILLRIIHTKCYSHEGLGIAYVAALRAKVNVLVYDKSPEQVDRGLRLMDKLLAKDVAKGRLVDYEAKEARERVQVVPQEKGMTGLRDVDMVVEVCVSYTCWSNELDHDSFAELSPWNV